MQNGSLSDEKRRQIEEMRRRFEQTDQTAKETSGSSFGIRLMISLLLFGVFLQFHLSENTSWKLRTGEAIEAVSQDADLHKLVESVKIQK